MNAHASRNSTAPDTPSLIMPPHPSDTALHAHLSLGSGRLTGEHRYLGVEIVAQNPELASSLARDSRRAERAGATAEAIDRLTRAIRLDQAAALDRTWLVRRAVLIEATGESGPRRALELYEIGCTLRHLGLWSDAERAYDAAARLDRSFLWPANNLSWMLATSADVQAHNPAKAVLAAEWACHRSGFGYWGFIGTLAAAFARNRDFERAVAWQQVSLRLTPEAHREDALRELAGYRRGDPWVDDGEGPAAGDVVDGKCLTGVNVPELLARAAALAGGGAVTFH